MIPGNFRPNLAATLTKPELIKFPVYCSPKIDGIRCVVFDGVAYSRSLKKIPNEFVQQWARQYAGALAGLDGELVVGAANDANCMQNTTSGVMRIKGEPDFTFYVFDSVDKVRNFETRYEYVNDVLIHDDLISIPRVRIVPQNTSNGIDELDHLESTYLELGYEGLMIRSPASLYKFGRSTEREGGLVKVKRFTDAEAEVVGFIEEMHNGNEATTDALGRTERSTQASGLTGKGTLGALRVSRNGVTFNIGTGFSAAERETLWAERVSLVGRIAKFKHFEHGTVDAPRHPVFLGFRHKDDM
jgi:DNA ligase-1